MIQNKEELVSNSSGDFREARADVFEILEYALERVQPKFAIQRAVRVKGDTLWLGGEVKRIFVIGFGKASGQMATEVERVLNDRISDGIVIVKHGSAQKARKIRIIMGRHPVPTMENVKATERLLEMVDESSV